MAVFNTNPGDEVVVTTNGETLTCKVLKVVGQGTHGTFSASIVEPIVPKNQIGDMHVKITINKDEILRDLAGTHKRACEAMVAAAREKYGLPIKLPHRLCAQCALCRIESEPDPDENKPIQVMYLPPKGTMKVHGETTIISWSVLSDGSAVVHYR